MRGQIDTFLSDRDNREVERNITNKDQYSPNSSGRIRGLSAGQTRERFDVNLNKRTGALSDRARYQCYVSGT